MGSHFVYKIFRKIKTVGAHQNAGRSYSMKIDNSSIERVEEFKYLGTTLTNKNCIHPRISNRSYSGRQVPLVSTIRGSPLAARGRTMGGNGSQMVPGILTQCSLTCRKSAKWDR
jgi:hypothetical protein